MKRNRHINLKEKFRNWCEKTTFHAIPNIATNEQLALKIMWTFCLIASIGYCCRILTSSIIDYYEYRVLTTFEIVQEASTFYPSITICNLNQFDLTKNKNLTDFFFNSYLTGNYLNDSVDLSLDPKQQFDLIKRKFLNYTNSSELENLRFTLNDMLISCYYNELPCYESDFYPLPNELYGNCYVFNSNLHRNNTLKSKVRNTSKYGPQYGLQLELFVGLNYQSFGNLRSGAILFIHNQSSLTDENDVGIELSSGTQSNIAINRMFIYKLAQPYSDCVDHNNLVKVEEIVRLTIEFHGYYSKSFCVDLCYQFYLLDQCNCYDNSAFYYLAKDYNSSRDVANCLSNNNTTDYYRDCYLRSKKNFLDSFYSEECFEKCPRECESVNYRIVSLSSAECISLLLINKIRFYFIIF